MHKRRAEILALAALILLAAVERPTIAIDLKPELYRVGDFAPQSVETVRDLGVIAVKLLVTWIG